ncbi:MAG TPA: tetratricopeptide repeat protein [Methylomirabilota bacterium]|jgi:tetratricopeptide (TPR) repeat protein/ADP-heptose:LPS heptosyltransferase|nr:tetratricopeptide repeat protein [Methylomirabilota bacterium]
MPSAVPGRSDETSRRLLSEAVRHHRAGELDQAIALYERLLKFVPDLAPAHANLGVALRARGRLEDAEASYRRALALAPATPDVLFNLGNLKRDQGALADAAEQYRAVLEADPAHAAAHTNLGLVLRDQGRLEEALAELSSVAAAQKDRPEPQLNIGLVLADMKRWADAARACHKALALNPRYAAALSLLGQCLRQLGHAEEAVGCCRRAVALAPDQPDAHAGLGHGLIAEGWLGEAAISFEQALALDPDHLQARLGRGYVHLVLGRWGPGLEDYRLRWRTREARPRRLPMPAWEGEDLAGQRILLWAEQGFGDTIAASRFVALVKAQGATVYLECPPALMRLFRPLPGVDRLITAGERLPQADLHAPLMELPRLFATYPSTVPPPPDLHPDPQLGAKFEPLFAKAGGRITVGIAWGGNPAYAGDAQRSLEFARFLPLADNPKVQLVSLQKGPQAEQLAAAPSGRILDAAPLLEDFADTAALMDRLDLVITVDSAPAHLAGTLGRPAWVLLPFTPYWFWLLDREDSPWYPSVRLFRQSKRADWAAVFERVAAELQSFER